MHLHNRLFYPQFFSTKLNRQHCRLPDRQIGLGLRLLILIFIILILIVPRFKVRLVFFVVFCLSSFISFYPFLLICIL